MHPFLPISLSSSLSPSCWCFKCVWCCLQRINSICRSACTKVCNKIATTREHTHTLTHPNSQRTHTHTLLTDTVDMCMTFGRQEAFDKTHRNCIVKIVSSWKTRFTVAIARADRDTVKGGRGTRWRPNRKLHCLSSKVKSQTTIRHFTWQCGSISLCIAFRGQLATGKRINW